MQVKEKFDRTIKEISNALTFYQDAEAEEIESMLQKRLAPFVEDLVLSNSLVGTMKKQIYGLNSKVKYLASLVEEAEIDRTISEILADQSEPA